jgi:O-antigen ligase
MGSEVYGALSGHAGRVARWSGIALGFSIPISVALDNALLALFVAGWAAGGAWRAKWQAIRSNPVALAALALLALLAAGTLYGERDPGDGVRYLLMYSDLLLVALLAFSFRDALARAHALRALAASLAIVLGLSYLVHFGILPHYKVSGVDEAAPIVFKHSLTHNILMAFGAYLFAQFAGQAASRWARACWAALAVLAAVNVLFMVPGRTGQLILAMLAVYGGYAWKGRRGLACAGTTVAVTAALVLLIPGPVQERFEQGWQEFSAWQSGQRGRPSSIGDRLDFYRASLAIVREHPWVGVGVGGFPRAYARHVESAPLAPSRNPHNEFLHIAVQLGAIGLAALLWLLVTQWRLSARLASAPETHLARALVLTIVTGCLFNSLLLDHTEGLLYAWLTGVLYGGLESKGDG